MFPNNQNLKQSKNQLNSSYQENKQQLFIQNQFKNTLSQQRLQTNLNQSVKTSTLEYSNLFCDNDKQNSQFENDNYEKQTKYSNRLIEQENGAFKSNQQPKDSNNKSDSQMKSQEQIMQLQREILEINKQKNNLEYKCSQYEQKLNSVFDKNNQEIVKKQQQEIKILQSKIANLQEQINKLTLQNKENQKTIEVQSQIRQKLNQERQKKNQYQSEIEQLNQELFGQIQQNNQLQENIKILKSENEMQIIFVENQINQNQEKENKINELNQFMNDLEQNIKNYEKQIQQLKDYQQEINMQNHFIPGKEISSYYDAVITMISILDLEIHQNLIFDSQNQNNKNLVSFQSNSDINILNKTQILVGMQGQRKTGKTFVLKLVMNQDLPSHFHENTPGICIKYQKNDSRNITYIDTQGANSPVTIDYESNQNYQNFMKNKGDGINDKNLQIINKFVANRHQFSKVTEQMLQEFVISNSHIIIIVVSDINSEDVNLIYSIQQYLDQQQNFNKKKIYVVHNLKNHHMQQYVEKYINSLKTKLPLRQEQIISYEKPIYQYNLVFIDNIYEDINHLFMAHQSSEAGKIYNKFTIDYLKAVIAQYTGESKFNFVYKFKDYLNNNIQRFLNLNSNEQIDLRQKQELIEFCEDKKIFYLNENYTIGKVKDLQLNIFGSMQKEYTYSITKNDKKLYLYIDIPGSVDVEHRLNKKKGQFNLKIKQKEYLEQDKGQILLSNRKHYEISQKIQICRKNKLYKFINEESKYLGNGVYLYVFEKEPHQDILE